MRSVPHLEARSNDEPPDAEWNDPEFFTDSREASAANGLDRIPSADRDAPRKLKKPVFQLHTESASELEKREFPPPKWAVPGLLPEGLSVLAAPPKTGKSWLALGLGCAVANAASALGHFPVDAGEVLYAALEDTPRRIQERLRLLLEETPAPNGLHFTYNLPSEGLEEVLESWLLQHPATRLIIIDTYARVKPAAGKSANVYESDYALAAPLQRFALENSIALLLIHHTKKKDEEDFLSNVSGSYGLPAAADAVLVLRKKRGELTGTLAATGRDIEERELAMSFGNESGTWTCTGDAAEARLSDTRQKIADCLTANGRLTPKGVAEKTGIPASSVRRLLPDMAEKGQVLKIGDAYSARVRFIAREQSEQGEQGEQGEQ